MKLLTAGAAVVTFVILGSSLSRAQTSNWNDAGSDSSWSDASNWTGGVPGATSSVIIGTQPASDFINVDTGSAVTISDLTFENNGSTALIGTTSPSLQVNGDITNSTAFEQDIDLEVIAGANATYDGGSMAGAFLSFHNGLDVGLNNIATSGTVDVGTLSQSSALTFALDSTSSYGKIGAITSSNLTVEITGTYAATASVANGNAGDLFQLTSSTSSFSGATLDTATLPTLDPSLVWITSLFSKGYLLVQPSAGGNIIKSPFVVPIDNDNEFNTGNITLDGGEILTNNNGDLSNGTPFSTSRLIGVSPNSGAISATAGTVATYNGAISDAVNGMPGLLTVGDTSLSVEGIGTVVFTATNSYSGGTQLYGGTLQLSGAGTLGATTNFLTIKSGILDLNGTQQTVAALILGSGGSELSDSSGNGAMLTATGTTVDGSGNAIDATVTLVSPTVTIDGAGTLTLNGTIQGNVAVNSGLIGGTVYPGTLTGSGTVTGTTTLTGLTSGMTSTGSSLLGTGSGLTLEGLVTFNGPANTLGGTVTANAGVTVASGGAVTQTGTLTGSLTSVAGTFTANGTVTGNAAIASGGTLAGTGSVGGTTDVTGGTVNGNGLILTGLTTFHGATGNILSGTESGDVSVASGGAVTQTGGTLTGDLTSVAGSFTADGTITGNAGIITGGTLAGSGTVEGTTDVNNAVVNGNGLTLTGLTTFHGANNSLDGTVTSTDGVTSTGGNLTIGSDANLTANGGLSVTGGTLAAADSTSTITGSVTYSSSSDSTFGGVIAGGTSAVTKNGAATLNLTGTNTYGGATDVNAGTLALTATGSLGASSITVANGATLASLGATNSVGGPITLDNGGAINLQNSATNTLDGTALNVAAGGDGILNIDVGSSGSDLINLSGGASLGANSSLTVNVESLGGETVGTQYAFLTAAGGLTNISSSDINGTLTGAPSGETLAFSVVGNSAYFTINGAASTNYYYNGASGGSGTNFALASNFDTDATSGFVQSAAPSATSNIFIATNTPANLTPTLNSALTINTLNFTPSGSGATLSGAGTLTINSAVTVQAGVTGTETIGAAVDLGGSQVWTVTDADSTLVDSGGIGESGGSFALTKAGAGTLVLTGTNTYSGGTTISAGTLQVGDGTTSNGSLGSGTVLDNASLVFDPHTTSTIANTISGTGTVTQTGPGTTILTGTGSSYSGGTTITSGTLQIGDGATSNGSIGTGLVTDNGSLAFDPSTTSTIANAITGSGSVTQNGPGTTILTSTNNDYSGGTTISAGTLQIGDGASSNGSLGTGGVTDNASLVFDPFTTSTIANAITGSGSVTQNGPGTTVLSGANSFTGATAVNSGALNLQNDSALGTGAGASSSGVTVASGAALQLQGGITTTTAVALTLNGTGAGNGALENVSGANTYSGLVTLASNTTIGSDSGILSLTNTGTITGSGFGLTLIGSGDGNIASIIGTGTGSLTKSGSGTWTLSGANTYSGGTTLSSGTLAVTGSGTLGASTNALTVSGGILDLGTTNQTVGTVSITAPSTIQNGTLTGTSFADTTSSGTVAITAGLAGSGGLTKSGAGTLALSGASSYSGGTTINAGILEVGSPTALGTGSVTNNATLEGFNGQHDLEVGANFTQNAGGTLVLNLNGNPGTNPGINDSNDVLSVAGTATLNGTLSLNFTFAPVAGQVFTVVETGQGIVGTPGANFTVPTVAPPGLDVTTSETMNGDDFLLTINSTQLRLTSIPGIVYTPNEAAIANYVSANVTSGPLFNALTQIVVSDPRLLPGIQDQLSPEKFASFARSNIVNNAVFSTQLLDDYLETLRSPQGDFMVGNGEINSSGLTLTDPTIDPGLSQVSSRLLAWSPAPFDHGLLSDSTTPVLGGIDMKAMPPAPPPAAGGNPFNVFVAGNAVLAQNFSQPDLAHTGSTSGAVQLGADYRVTPHLRVGALFNYSHTDAELDTIGSRATIDSYAPGGYLSFADKGWYANGVATYGFDNYTEDRHVAFPGFTEVAHGAPSGNQVDADLDGGYDFHMKNWTFGPLTGLQYTHFTVDSYGEDGAGAVDLHVGQQQTDSLRTRLGGHVSYSVKTGKVILTPHVDASWQHEFMDQSDGIDAQIANIAGTPFVVRTPNPSRESALIDAGLSAELNGQVSVFADYVVQAGQSNYFGQSIQAGIKLGF